ncbi:MAG: hypothetical protein Ct9H90mP27_4170 [Gammaproteobacteria bacterium]|nr:MAG: hypothetical protein Ct9H90mP27_4170 [Gammaproteobacteria bacterium]
MSLLLAMGATPRNFFDPQICIRFFKDSYSLSYANLGKRCFKSELRKMKLVQIGYRGLLQGENRIWGRRCSAFFCAV